MVPKAKIGDLMISLVEPEHWAVHGKYISGIVVAVEPILRRAGYHYTIEWANGNRFAYNGAELEKYKEYLRLLDE